MGIREPQPAEQGENRSLALDGWRGVASLLVYWHHTGTAILLSPLVVWGYTGVHLFFVLSGYLIFRPFLLGLLSVRPYPSVHVYCLRRFLRIGPPYLVALAIAVAARFLAQRHPPDASTIVAHALMVFNYCPGENFFRINGVFWTLMIEAQFYLFLPFVLCAFRAAFPTRGRQIAWLVIVLFLATGPLARAFEFHLVDAQGAPIGGVRFRSLFSFLDMFGFGMAVAYLEWRYRDHIKSRGALAHVLLLAGALLFLGGNLYAYSMHQEQHDWLSCSSLPFAILYPGILCSGIALVLFLACTEPRGVLKVLCWRPLVLVGTISYSLYLYHTLVLLVLMRFVDLSFIPGDRFRGFVYGVIFLGPTLLFTFLVYRLFERPSLKWSQRFRP